MEAPGLAWMRSEDRVELVAVRDRVLETWQARIDSASGAVEVGAGPEAAPSRSMARRADLLASACDGAAGEAVELRPSRDPVSAASRRCVRSTMIAAEEAERYLVEVVVANSLAAGGLKAVVGEEQEAKSSPDHPGALREIETTSGAWRIAHLGMLREAPGRLLHTTSDTPPESGTEPGRADPGGSAGRSGVSSWRSPGRSAGRDFVGNSWWRERLRDRQSTLSARPGAEAGASPHTSASETAWLTHRQAAGVRKESTDSPTAASEKAVRADEPWSQEEELAMAEKGC